MRIAKLSLLAYGAFEGEEIVFGDEGTLDVVFGPNEAGKSTTLRAVIGVLFGIETQTKDAYLHDMSELRIGARLVNDSGGTLDVLRRKGKRGNTLLDPSGKPTDEAPLTRMLGGATREVFEATYGLDHERLRRGAEALLDGQGDLGESLFGASVGSTSLHALRKRVDEEASAIYSSRAKNLPLNEALRQYAEQKKQVLQNATLPEVHEKQSRAIADGKAEHKTLMTARADLMQEQARLLRLVELLPALDTARSRVRDLERDEQDLTSRRAEIVIDAGLDALHDAMAAVQERLSGQRTAMVALPEARGALAQVQAEVVAAMRALGREGDPREARSLLLDDATQAEIERLASDSRRFAEREEEARDAIEAARGRLALLPVDSGLASRDLTSLEAALQLARQAGDLPATIAAARSRATKLETSVHTKTEGDATLLASHVPSMEAVLASERATRESARELAGMKEAVSAIEEDIASAELSLARFVAEGVPRSLKDVARAREERDTQWHALLKAKADAKKKEEVAFVDKMRAADSVSDQLLSEASRAAAHAQLLLARDALLRRREISQNRLADAQARVETAHKEWLALWRGTKVTAGSHEEMRAWLQKHAAVTAANSELADLRIDIESSAARANELGERLRSELRSLEVDVTAKADFSHTCAFAEVTLARLRDEATHAREALVSRRAAEESLRSAETQAAVRSKEREEWRRSWQRGLEFLGLDADASREAAMAAVAAQKRLGTAVAATEQMAQRVAQLERTTTDLEAIVRDLAAAHAPDLANLPTLDAATELIKRAAATREAMAEARRTDEAILKLRADLGRERANASRLAEEAEKASHGQVDASITGARLRSMEIERVLEETSERMDRIQHQIGGWESGLSDMKSSRAATTANEAEETLAKAADYAQRYARLKLASAVLAREIERFRLVHQGPVLARASDHFAALTRGEYKGLSEGFGDNDEPVLRAVREKTDLAVDALSDGARDALYLALRLASWEHLATSNVPLPVVLDDVLIQLDDDRATAALTLLGEVAQTMQIIIFTHHSRIVDLARAALGPRVHVTVLARKSA